MDISLLVSQAEMNTDPDVRNILLEELTVRRRALVHLEHDHDKAHGMPRRSVVRDLETDPSAHGLGPIVLLGGFQVEAAYQLQRAGATAPQFGTPVEEFWCDGLRVA